MLIIKMEYIDENNNYYIGEPIFEKNIEVPENYEIITVKDQDDDIKMLSFKYETGRSS